MSMRTLSFLAAALACPPAPAHRGQRPSGLVTQGCSVLVVPVLAAIRRTGSNQSGWTSVTPARDRLCAYLASNPLHQRTSGVNGFLAASGTSVDFDLGASFLISHLGLWNDNDFQGVREFSVQVADNAAFAGANVVGEFMAQYGPQDYSLPGPDAVLRTLPDTTDVMCVWSSRTTTAALAQSGNPYVNVGEVVFGVQAAAAPKPFPEPASLALAGLPGGGACRFAAPRLKLLSRRQTGA